MKSNQKSSTLQKMPDHRDTMWDGLLYVLYLEILIDRFAPVIRL